MDATPVKASGVFNFSILSGSMEERRVPKLQPRPITPIQGISG